jgi:hypothetical protein
VKTFALAEATIEVAACDVDAETGAARYQLVYHSVGQSFALPIARRHGVPDRAIEVAERLLSGESQDLARAIDRLETARRQLDRARDDAEAERDRLERARTDAETLAADLRAASASDGPTTSRSRAASCATSSGRAAPSWTSCAPGPSPRRFAGSSAKPRRQSPRTRPAEQPAAPAARRRSATRSRSSAAASAASSSRSTASARASSAGGLRFEVGLAQVRVVGEQPRRERVAVSVARPVEADHERGEINLVGQRVREGIDALAAFLDRSVRLGLSEVASSTASARARSDARCRSFSPRAPTARASVRKTARVAAAASRSSSSRESSGARSGAT